MATAFAKFFKKKNNKENNEPQTFNREKADRFSFRQHKSSNISSVHNADVYTGEQRYNDAFVNRDYANADRDRAGLQPFNASLVSQLPYRSPYDIVTEAKTTKTTRSCPGGNRGPRPLLHQRRFSPQSSDHRRCYQQHPPTIHEVSGSYENYPSNSQLASMFEEKDGYVDDSSKSDIGRRARKYNSEREDKRLRYRNSESLDYRNENDLNDHRFHKSFTSSKGRQMPSGSWSHQNQSAYRANTYHGGGHNYPLPNSTSEYGSADPSPTNQVMQSHRTNQNDFFQDNSFDNTDYDSDSDSVTMFMKQQLKKAKAKCDMYKEKAKAYKKRYANLLLTLNDVKEQLSCEKRDNDMLRARLMEQEKLCRMTKIVQQQQQFCQVSSAHQHPSHGQQHHRNPNFLTNDNNSALHCLTGGGAGEALCSRTELTSADADMLLTMASTAQQQKCLNDVEASLVNNSGLFNMQNDNELGMNDESCAEQPRCANVTNDMSPITTFYGGNAMTTSLVYNESKQLTSKTDDDGYSTMQQPIFSEKNEANLLDQTSTDNDDESKRRNAEIVFAKKGDSSTSSCSVLSSNAPTDVAESSAYIADNSDTKRMGNESKLSGKDKNTPNTIANVITETTSQHPRHIRRSFSDSEVSKITSDSYVEDCGEYLNKEVVIDLADLEPPTSSALSSRKVVFCDSQMSKKRIGTMRGHPKRYASRHGDYSSSYSSDDETARILAKQLSRRGSVVQFRPPRKSVVHNEKQLFKHFGNDERKAIAEFEYLHNIPTDVSGLPSSPEVSSKSKQRMDKD